MNRNRLFATIAIICLLLGFIIGQLTTLNNLSQVGFLLAGLAFGMVLGFLVNWLLEEAYQRNQSLVEQLENLQPNPPPSASTSLPLTLGMSAALQPTVSPESKAAPARLSGMHPDINIEPIESVEEPPAKILTEPDLQTAYLLPVDRFAQFLYQQDEEIKQLQAKLEKVNIKLARKKASFETYVKTHPDDLSLIKGIGPIYEWKLRDLGFTTFAELAEADKDRLRRLLEIETWQDVDVDSWINQAHDRTAAKKSDVAEE